MNSSHPILIAYDGSANARHAVKWAGERFPGVSATVLHVWEPAEAAAARHGAMGLTDGAVLREAHGEAAAAAARLAAEGAELARAAGLRAEGRAEPSVVPVWETIVRAADEADAALIVLGSRGLRGLRSLMLGGVSHQVAHHAHQPVLVVPSEDLARARRALASDGTAVPA